MKSILLAITLLSSSIVFGQDVTVNTHSSKLVTVTSICEGGYTFVIIVTARGYSWSRGVSITQKYVQGTVGSKTPQPEKC